MKSVYWLKYGCYCCHGKGNQPVCIFSYDALDNGVQTKSKEKRAETITLENATPNRKGRSMTLIRDNKIQGIEIVPQTN